ncbi:hypothetical protein A8L45_16285 [Veronia pacifica]|uniref:HTH araC/xylS-type domain-containing protein n=2 Tax=Veronia pacifica TaxID=1080227 RepID=A0A1C3EE81_9GAMM|nr:hypothetical protein A8L45_16285 [Veronia pacifica]
MTVESFLENTNIEWEELLNDKEFITFEQFSRLKARTVEVSGRPWVAFDIAKTILTSHHSSFGFGIAVCQTLGKAVSFITNFMCIRQKIFSSYSVEEPGGLKIVFTPTIELGEDEEYASIAVLTLFYQSVASIIGDKVENWVFTLSYPQPEWHQEYEKAMPDNHFLFGQSDVSIFIPNDYLNISSLTYEPDAYHIATSQCERIKKQQETKQDIVLRVRCVLLSSDNLFISLDDVASTLNMSTRTLIRKLKAEGSTYQLILDNIRKEFAIWYLTKSNMPIEKISDTLGYQEASNFSRTFKRWMNKTPSEFRLDAAKKKE